MTTRRPDLEGDDTQRPTMVVGLDGSAGSHVALRWAMAHVEQLGLIQPVVGWKFPWWATAPPTPGGPPPPPRDYFSNQAQEVAERETSVIPVADRLPAIVANGHVGHTLCAATKPDDVIVVGSRGRGAVAEAITGSTSSYCASHSTVPVVIVPESAASSGTRRVVVGVDGSANAVSALVWAIEHCPSGATIDVVHAYVPAAPMFELAETYGDVFETRAQAVLDKSVESARLAARRSPAEYELDARIVMAVPRSALRDAEADMIVVGARGHRGVAHLLLGSVATALTHHTDATTVVVPGDRI